MKVEFKMLQLGDVRPRSWMKQQMLDDLQHGFAACLDEISPRASSGAFTGNRAACAAVAEAGMVEDVPCGWWDGETQAVWWDGFVRMAYLSGDEAAIGKADRVMAELLDSRDESGYIGIYAPKWRYRHDDENGEFWTQSRAFVAMLAYYELTGKAEYLDAVERAMQLTMQHYGPGHSYFNVKRPAGGTCHGLMLVDVCEWLFRLTGKDAYRDFGVWCYEDYSATEQVRDTDNQLENLLDLDKDFTWHTPHTTEHLRVPLWVASVTDDPKFQQAAANAFTKIQRYLTPSGACIGAESIKDFKPTPDMTYEYCAITELLTSLQSASQKTGNRQWADMTEWLAFNAAQGARLADGKGISYMTMDNRFAATTEGNGGRRKLSPTHEDIAVCCNPNAIKLLPYYTNRMWMRLADGEGMCALCYGPSELHTEIAGTKVKITQETDYPFSEQIVFHIEPERPVTFELRLRIPGWAQGYELDAGDAQITEEEGFCRIQREWRAGDEISLSLRCEVESVSACDGDVGVKRGPLLYSLPIAAKNTVLREYPGHDLADLAFEPSEELNTYSLVPAELDFQTHRDPDADRLRPWRISPISLKGNLYNENGEAVSATLVPIGCTVLRQTMFKKSKAKVKKRSPSALPAFHLSASGTRHALRCLITMSRMTSTGASTPLKRSN
ncbi:MAG: glycoside hydrolase family 127 protein [Lentisphaeria bacterium]|nr:glycoside hydrolase family 127 protein [Lentisphaeria bacterium]